MVSCPVASLRSRGHAGMGAIFAATDPHSRFRLLRRMVNRCPWPNATGLLLDVFRKEMDRGLRRPGSNGGVSAGDGDEDGDGDGAAAAPPCAAGTGGSSAPGAGRAWQPVDDQGGVSPFASPACGEFVCEQLRRACGKGPPSLLLMDMDSRTGALILGRYAHALDRTTGGRLGLREGRRLGANRALVEVRGVQR